MSQPLPNYTPHFVVVGGPCPHPAGDGRMGVCLIASKALKEFELEEIVKEKPPWHSIYYNFMPHEYDTYFHIELDHRAQEIYVQIWGETYAEAWEALFLAWGPNPQPDVPQAAINPPRRELHG